MPATKEKKREASQSSELRQERVDAIAAGEVAKRRQAELIDAIEAKLGRLSLATFGRVQAGLNPEGTARLRDPEVITAIQEYRSLEDTIHAGIIAARDLRENPPGWMVERRQELSNMIHQAEQRIVRARAELDQLSEQAMEADPHPVATDHNDLRLVSA